MMNVSHNVFVARRFSFRSNALQGFAVSRSLFKETKQLGACDTVGGHKSASVSEL
jgi:hypothetical protein